MPSIMKTNGSNPIKYYLRKWFIKQAFESNYGSTECIAPINENLRLLSLHMTIEFQAIEFSFLTLLALARTGYKTLFQWNRINARLT